MTETYTVTRTVIEEYKNAKKLLTTEMQKIYQAPTSVKASVLLAAHFATIDSVNDGQITVGWTDYTDSNFMTYLITNGNIAARAALNLLDHEKLVLEPGDAFYARASELNRIHVTLSILEIS